MRAPPEPSDPAWRGAQRRRLIAARMAMSREARASASAKIDAALIARLAPGSIGLIGGYWPIQGEFDVLPYLRRCLEAGAAVALPVVAKRDTPLRFRLWTPESQMVTGRWEIQHPADGAIAAPEALLIPLVGFDAAGYRLGYGGGYFDRTLATMSPRPLAAGVGFELCRLSDIGPQPHDRKMDLIVTEAGVFDE